jgi:hypothetical protein
MPSLKSRLPLQHAKSGERCARRKVDHQQRTHTEPPTAITLDVDEKFTVALRNVVSPD